MPHQHHVKHQHVRARDMHLNPRQQETIVQVVYKTAAKTFDGPIGGYKTLDGSDDNGDDGNSPAAVAPNTQQAAPPPQEESSTPPPVRATPTPAPEIDPATPTTQAETPKAAATTQQAQAPSSQTAAAAAPVSSSEKPKPSISEAVASSSSKPTEAKATHATKTSSQKSDSAPSQTPSQIAAASSTQDGSSASSSFIDQSASTSSSAAAGASASHSSGGMSGGAKAGLAIGILLAIGLLAGLIFFCYRRKKKNANRTYEQADDEKSVTPGPAGGAAIDRSASTRTAATAPRLSLRPVTQFLPDIPGRRKSVNLLATAGGRSAAPAAAMTEKQSVQNQSNNPANPFGNHAEPSETAVAPRDEKAIIPNQANNPTNPFGNHAETIDHPINAERSVPADGPVPAPLRIRTPTPDGNVAAAGAALAAAGAASSGRDTPRPLNLGSERSASPAPIPSPAGTEFSINSITPAAMMNGPPPTNVHRVQLDFKPSMADELALRAGQLVRLLHEYDDGWALCIRLDRSQQGVAPRSCLSARPVKPRPNPNVRGPPSRGPPPPGMFGPGQQRPMSPSSGRGSPSPYDRAPRGMVSGPHPAQRSMSPGPYGGGPQRVNIPPPGSRRRSNSASDVRERRNSPPGPSPMNPNAQNILSGIQKVPMQLQAITAPDQALPATSLSSSMPPRKPVPGQAM